MKKDRKKPFKIRVGTSLKGVQRAAGKKPIFSKKKALAAGLVMNTLAAVTLTGCINPMEPLKEGLSEPVKAVDSLQAEEALPYAKEGTAPTLVGEYQTPNGLCKVKVYENYFDVTLDEETAGPYEAGKAYGEAILAIAPDFTKVIEPYIFENIKMAFSDLNEDYAPVEKRMETLYATLDEHYRQEIEGMAEVLCGDNHGIKPDGVVSTEELKLAQMVPDALRPTACSALSLWGSKTETGDMISVRCLEWLLGSDKAMTKVHTVLHIKNGDRSITNYSFLGIFETISGINESGLFAAMLDADCEKKYEVEGRTCYSFAIRHVLEEYDTAKEAGEYLTSHSAEYPFNHNVFLTDGKEAYCAEDCVKQLQDSGEGHPCLRDFRTPLMKELSWDSPDSFCIINSFVSEGNYEAMSGLGMNTVRFAKYNQLVLGLDRASMGDVKDAMTREKVNTTRLGSSTVQNVHRDGLTQMILVDYHTGNVQIAFTGQEGVTDKPVFTAVGNYREPVE